MWRLISFHFHRRNELNLSPTLESHQCVASFKNIIQSSSWLDCKVPYEKLDLLRILFISNHQIWFEFRVLLIMRKKMLTHSQQKSDDILKFCHFMLKWICRVYILFSIFEWDFLRKSNSHHFALQTALQS